MPPVFMPNDPISYLATGAALFRHRKARTELLTTVFVQAKHPTSIAQMDLHAIKVDLVCFDKLRSILRSRQQGSTRYPAREVLETLKACKLQYEVVFAEYGDRLSETDRQLLLAEVDSLDELVRAEREPENSSANPESPALKQESTITYSQEASCIELCDDDGNADHHSKADKRQEYHAVEIVGVVDIGAGEEGKDSNSLAELHSIEEEDFDQPC